MHSRATRLALPFFAGLVCAALAVAFWRSWGPAPGDEAEARRFFAWTGSPEPEREGSGELRPRPGWTLAVDGWQIAVEGRSNVLPSFADAADAASRTAWPEENEGSLDQLIVTHSLAQGLDWRLVAALIEEESGFDPQAESPKGAVGLMQVRPVAAAQVGEVSFHAPEDNIRTGVKYLRYLDEQLSDVHPADRLAFVLAAYHMGLAHVRDAQALARELGLSPRHWHGHVGRVLPLLEEPAIYQRLPAGYAQGRLTAAYVSRVLQRYVERAEQEASLASSPQS